MYLCITLENSNTAKIVKILCQNFELFYEMLISSLFYSLQILGTGMDTQDTSPSVLLFFDRERFIFNAGEVSLVDKQIFFYCLSLVDIFKSFYVS